MKSSSIMHSATRGSEPLAAFGDPIASELLRAETERLASLGGLAAGVAHEINNPLAYLIGSLDIGLRELEAVRDGMQGRPNQDSDRLSGALTALASAREGAERVRHIVRHLLDGARTNSGFNVANRGDIESVNVEAVLDASVRVAWNQIRHRGRLVKRYAGLPRVRGDETRLGQVFLNLIVNAAQALDGDPARSEITLSTRAESRGAVVEISDTGGGIEAGEQERIFDAFYSTKAPGQGMGLGLAICRGIVSALGGEISVASERGRGSIFTVVLPYAPEDSAARGPVVSAPEAEPPPSRILIIDDEPLLGQTLLYAFKGRHEVSICTSGRDALNRLETDWQFDLVLCDLMMPAVSGAAVYNAVKTQHPELIPRFVFMTGGAFTERAREFLSQHPGPQLEKPFTIGEIEKILGQVTAALGARPRPGSAAQRP